MGASKRRTRPPGAKRRQATGPGVREFTVVLEDLRSHFTVFGEALQGTRQEMSRRFEHVESELAVVKKDQELMKADLQLVKSDQELMKADLQLVKSAVLEHGRDLKAMRASIEKKPNQEEVVAIVREMITEYTQP
jgi:hypothetical protein